jgi:hypothetical protein
MEQQNQYRRLTEFIVGQKFLASEPFSLIDVGCSGGISGFWRVFEPSLKALGVDPLVREVDRLGQQETNLDIKYTASLVGLPPDHPQPMQRGDAPPTRGNPWSRLSAHTASEIMRAGTPQSEALAVLNNWNESEDKAVSTVGIDELVADNSIANVDFIKIDIDGFDLDALISAERSIREFPVLGLAVEVNFYGSNSASDHTFHNTDRLLRSWGFDLFDLSVRRYSVAALPQPFQWDIPAQTVRGRPYQGDAVYLRDPCALSCGKSAEPSLSNNKILKLVCLFELFGLPDHAAELLVLYRQSIAQHFPVERLLNILAGEIDPLGESYEEYVNRFRRDPSSLFPSKLNKK